LKGIFRRLPAHYSQEAALQALGTRWRAKRIEYQQNKLKRHGIAVPVTGTINAPISPAALEEIVVGILYFFSFIIISIFITTIIIIIIVGVF